MATRRPKVPRASPLGKPSTENADGGDVIRADFGTGRSSVGSGGSAASDKVASPKAPARDSSKTGSNTSQGTNTPQGNISRGTAKSSSQAPAKGRAQAPQYRTTAKGGTGAGGGNGKGDGRGEDQQPVPARAFSGRMLALAVVMIAITVMLAPTVKIFFEKRAEIAALEHEIATKKSEQEDLRRQVSRWQDPNYVKQQARDRINMVMPGETSYWVFGGGESAGTTGGKTGTGASGNPANLPWVDGLWESIRRSATD